VDNQAWDRDFRHESSRQIAQEKQSVIHAPEIQEGEDLRRVTAAHRNWKWALHWERTKENGRTFDYVPAGPRNPDRALAVKVDPDFCPTPSQAEPEILTPTVVASLPGEDAKYS
jgi:hypothetical protein